MNVTVQLVTALCFYFLLLNNHDIANKLASILAESKSFIRVILTFLCIVPLIILTVYGMKLAIC